MSGTPIQNRLTDLASIFEFLKVYPFSNPKVFDAEISQLWQKSDRDGILRLKRLVNLVTLCRTKAVVDLPRRVDEVHHLDFSPAEHKIYEAAKSRTAQMLDHALSIDYTQRMTYLNALQWLNKLRLICNHGVLHSIRDARPKIEPSLAWSQSIAQKAFEDMLDAGAAICVACSVNLVEATSEDAASHLAKPRLSECLFLICGSCLSRCSTESSFSACSHNPKHLTYDVSLEVSTVFVTKEGETPEIDQTETPTKLRALIEDLQKHQDEKRYEFRLLLHSTLTAYTIA